MGDTDGDLRHEFLQPFLQALDIADPRADIETLSAAEMLAHDCFADRHAVIGQDEGADSEAVDGRGRDQAELTHAGERELQGARDRGGRQGQHMDIATQALEPLLLCDAEMLFLVDDEQAEVLEGDGIGQERMCADHDVDLPVLEARAHILGFLARRQPRELRDPDREPLEALFEGPEMLARQQCRGNDHGDLASAQRRHEGGAQGHLGLPEADVSAYEPVHGLACREARDGVVDGAVLVLGLAERKSGAELFIEARRWRQLRCVTQFAFGSQRHQLVGHLRDAILDPRPPCLPTGVAQLVELHTRLLRAVARQQVEVLDREEKLVVARIDKPQTVMGSAADFERLEPVVAPDPVISMDHDIPERQARHLRDEMLGGFRLAPAPDQPIAENVLLAVNGPAWKREAMFQRQDANGHLILRCGEHPVPARDRKRGVDLVIREELVQTVARTGRVTRDGDGLSLGLLIADAGSHGVEQVGIDTVAGLGEIDRSAPADGMTASLAVRPLETVEFGDCPSLAKIHPFVRRQIKSVRR